MGTQSKYDAKVRLTPPKIENVDGANAQLNSVACQTAKLQTPNEELKSFKSQIKESYEKIRGRELRVDPGVLKSPERKETTPEPDYQEFSEYIKEFGFTLEDFHISSREDTARKITLAKESLTKEEREVIDGKHALTFSAPFFRGGGPLPKPGKK